MITYCFETQSWQDEDCLLKKDGIRDSGMSCRAIARQLGYHHSVITRLVQKHAQTNDVKDRARSGRSKVTFVREDRALLWHVRRLPFTSAPVLRDNWNTHRRVSISTVRNRLRVVGYRARRPLKRTKLQPRHINARLAWCIDYHLVSGKNEPSL